MRVVVALGGNALLRRGECPDAAVQLAHVAQAAPELVGAEALVMLTDVAAVVRGFGTPEATPLGRVAPEELDALSFPAGSMGPKVDAACRFVRRRLRTALWLAVGVGEPVDVGVIWDMDGTLVASATVVPDAFIETVRQLGAEPPDRDGVVALYDLGNPQAILGQMLDRAGTEDDSERYHQVLRGMSDQVRVHDGVVEVLTELRGRGVPLAVFTGNSHQAAAILLEGTGLRVHFDAVVGGNEVDRAKPAPDGVLVAADLLGLAPARCLYVGDSPLDVGAAEAAGALPVHAGWGHLYDDALGHPTAETPADVLGFVERLARG